MVNPLGHWLQVSFCTISRIPLRELSGFQEIGFRIPLRGLSGFWVPRVLVVTVIHKQTNFKSVQRCGKNMSTPISYHNIALIEPTRPALAIS